MLSFSSSGTLAERSRRCLAESPVDQPELGGGCWGAPQSVCLSIYLSVDRSHRKKCASKRSEKRRFLVRNDTNVEEPTPTAADPFSFRSLSSLFSWSSLSKSSAAWGTRSTLREAPGLRRSSARQITSLLTVLRKRE